MTPEELMNQAERLLILAVDSLPERHDPHITPMQRDHITSLAMTGHALAALARARLEAEGPTELPAAGGRAVLPEPQDWVRSTAVIRRCGHNEMCLRHRGVWLHPYSLTVCNNPPSGEPDRPAKTVVTPMPKEAP